MKLFLSLLFVPVIALAGVGAGVGGGGGGGATIPATTAIIRGDGAGNGAAASASEINTVINSTVAPVFSNLSSKPTSAAGYSITNGATIDLWGAKALPTGAVLGTTDAQVVTNKDLTGAGNTFPTLNQNTTGSAATLTTPRTIAGVSFNGSANIALASTNLSDTASIATLTGTQALTSKDLTGAGNTFPTFNQNTTGSAATLTTARTIAGVSFNGSANISLASTNLSDTASLPLLSADNTFTGQNTFGIGTITTSKPQTWTQTWNASGVTFTGIKENITNTASATGSLLLDLQVGGVSKATIDKLGNPTFAGDTFLLNGRQITNGIGQNSQYRFRFWNNALNATTNIYGTGLIESSGSVTLGPGDSSTTYVLSTVAYYPGTDGTLNLGDATHGWQQFYVANTITAAGSTGAKTINKARGTVRFAAGASTLVVTDSLVAATTKVMARGIGAFDATATNFQCTAAAGSFTITANAAATAEIEALFEIVIP